MASALARAKRTCCLSSAAATMAIRRTFASVSVGSDIVSAAPNVALQKARTWDEGVSSNFSTTPVKEIFQVSRLSAFFHFITRLSFIWEKSCHLWLTCKFGAYTGVCSTQHVPSYKNNIGKFKAKGIDSVICVSVNDPYVMNGWAEKLQAKEAVNNDMIMYAVSDKIEFYGDFDGTFHKSLELELDLSAALLGHRSQR
ncbi:hypothetical protein BHM03_00005159 [Ensete ventricosum]|nr:hypothetical protein BHM03_00005159 [Ensete ventricosum]